ncbi:PilZ domain-containing protein [Paraburkholderia sp. ZP32-5]|uniref:PilZ domain-containing protein n=1 Tax=Paraburkholderia sp. ZP32-5 TaxID=2883245 RepID=UPI001F2BFDE9|nr:PilZ domain-containing protein [Paraburkholderia sp. ZP32-5]
MTGKLDLRREDRAQMLFAPTLLGKEGRALARVADLSMHGALLYARRGLFSKGETISGWLQSLPIDGGDEIFLAVGLSVRWISEDNEAGWSCIGCEMLPMDADSLGTLQHLIEVSAP